MTHGTTLPQSGFPNLSLTSTWIHFKSLPACAILCLPGSPQQKEKKDPSPPRPPSPTGTSKKVPRPPSPNPPCRSAGGLLKPSGRSEPEDSASDSSAWGRPEAEPVVRRRTRTGAEATKQRRKQRSHIQLPRYGTFVYFLGGGLEKAGTTSIESWAQTIAQTCSNRGRRPGTRRNKLFKTDCKHLINL